MPTPDIQHVVPSLYRRNGSKLWFWGAGIEPGATVTLRHCHPTRGVVEVWTGTVVKQARDDRSCHVNLRYAITDDACEMRKAAWEDDLATVSVTITQDSTPTPQSDLLVMIDGPSS